MAFSPISGQLGAGPASRGLMPAPLLGTVPKYGQDDKANDASPCPAGAIQICGTDHDMLMCGNQQIIAQIVRTHLRTIVTSDHLLLRDARPMPYPRRRLAPMTAGLSCAHRERAEQSCRHQDRIEQTFGIELPLATLLGATTIARLAKVLQKSGPAISPVIGTTDRSSSWYGATFR
jgi:hypothetical protein